MKGLRGFALSLGASQIGLVRGIVIDPTSSDNITASVKLIANEMMGYYVGNQPGQTPGYLPNSGSVDGYYWWVGGGMFGTMVNYWYHTGDATWLNATAQAIYFQSDPSSGGFFDSANVSAQLGNDDQSFWAFAAMLATEYKVPSPPAPYPSWLAMVQGVFNQQVQRWDPLTCNGGLRWQVFPLNQGYDYKNSISNGAFFNIASRLGKYTGNTTYIDQATRFWDWSVEEGLIDNSTYAIIDGIVVDDCSDYGHTEQWTYNLGVFMYGAAAMWNITQTIQEYEPQASTWEARVTGLVNAASTFFMKDPAGDGVLTEVICEPQNKCAVDGSTFKAYLARWMRVTAQVAPFTASTISSMLEPSVQAAATACSGPPINGPSGVACGQQWYTGSFDGRVGIGMQMCAMEVIQTLLDTPGPVTFDQGISKSDPSAGSNPVGRVNGTVDSGVITVTTADRAGAAILTLIFSACTLAGGWWIIK